MAKSSYEKLYDSMKAELDKPEDTPPANDQPNGAGAQPPQETPQETPPASEEPHAETPPASEDNPATPPNPGEPPVSPAEHAFRRQLNKQKQKYEDQIKSITEGFNKQIEDLKGQISGLKPKEPDKTREDFATDDEYIDYLTKKRVDAILAERDANAKKAADEAAAKKKEQDDADAEVQERRNAFNANVDEAFGHDQARHATFNKRLAYCMERGLGEILDKVPIASNFLMNHPRGPLVFEKILSDKDTFSRAFNERMLDPMDIYYELRKIDEELKVAAAQPNNQGNPPANPAQPPVNRTPHMGRPGKQGGNDAGEPDIFTNKDAMIQYLRSH